MASESKVPLQPIEGSQIKKGKFIMLKGKPCKVMDVKTSKTGKHGHMKVNITGIDVLTSKKYNDVQPGHATFTEFKMDKQELQLLDINDENTVELMDGKGHQVLVTGDPESEVFKKMKEEFAAGKSLMVGVVRAPVEISKDKFKDDEIIESFKEDRSGADT